MNSEIKLDNLASLNSIRKLLTFFVMFAIMIGTIKSHTSNLQYEQKESKK